jgi:mRNA-degrading endonuclease RelE of RelBE toxin-antitoxin system
VINPGTVKLNAVNRNSKKSGNICCLCEISYICGVKEVEEIRTVLYSEEFKEFCESLDERAVEKLEDNVSILKTVYVLSTKFVKRIVNTNLYEMRVSVGYNEYRSILFTIDHENVIQATEIILLTGFLKKSSKDYGKQIKRAINILNNLEL